MNAHSGKTAIVTGASAGIGRAIAETLARRDTPSSAPAAGRERPPKPVRMLTCDVTDEGAVQALIARVLARPARSTCWSTTPGSA